MRMTSKWIEQLKVAGFLPAGLVLKEGSAVGGIFENPNHKYFIELCLDEQTKKSNIRVLRKHEGRCYSVRKHVRIAAAIKDAKNRGEWRPGAHQVPAW